MINTPSWKALKAHQQTIVDRHLKDMFKNDPERFKKFSLACGGIFLDYSKNRASDTTVRLLLSMAREVGLEQKIADIFAGKKVNTTERRAVLHTALRQQSGKAIFVDGENVVTEILASLAKMREFCEGVHSGAIVSSKDQKFTDVLSIGIGGSFLGPKIVVEALKNYRNNSIRIHFVANVDGSHLHDVLNGLNLRTTLVVIASKSFTTQETMLNARSTRNWFEKHGFTKADIEKHFVAISSDVAKAGEFGIHQENIFPMWDWVGGRYSLWSAIGLPIALSIGFEHFRQLLLGAHEMDEHFRKTPLENNMPVIMALLGIWNINFWGATSHCIIPYCHYLRGLPAHIQQLDMESNGKSVSKGGVPLSYSTGPAIWGSEGVNSQHAFFQQIHQSKTVYPVDFILPLSVGSNLPEHHDMLVSHCFAQSQALMTGKTIAQARAELLQAGISAQQSDALAPHKAMAGNKPNNVLLMSELSPKNVGALIALYEHKVVTQGLIWNINSFDQWGVELGKKLSKPIHQCISQTQSISSTGLDCSTTSLIEKYLAFKKSQTT